MQAPAGSETPVGWSNRGFNDRRRQALVAALDDADPELTAIALAGAVVYSRVMGSHPLCPDRADELLTGVL